MVSTLFATKLGMMQVWTKQGKRLAVTRCHVAPNLVVSTTPSSSTPDSSTSSPSTLSTYQLGYGQKKLKNMTKPLRVRLEKAGISAGVKQLRTVKADAGEDQVSYTPGQVIELNQVFQVGDIVKIRGTSKGRGFAGAIKRYGFSGGPKTHGQSDRHRAVGSIGSGTTPGRVFMGKRMPGHYGDETRTVRGLVVLHIDPEQQEVWVSGPIPGSISSTVEITKTGGSKSVELASMGEETEAVNQPVTETEPETPAESEPMAEEAVKAEAKEVEDKSEQPAEKSEQKEADATA